jgi:hypothetical protein
MANFFGVMGLTLRKHTELVCLVLKATAFMKYSQWIGLTAAIILIASCFLPWTYHPDLDKTFTGFFSENNAYGKPGKALILLAALASMCFLIRRVWAKRGNFFISALLIAYAIRSFMVFSGCYRGICPEKREGLWIMLISATIILIMAVLPDIKITAKSAGS